MSHLIQMLKNQVQFLICYNYVQKFHHRRVIELLQNGNFPDQRESVSDYIVNPIKKVLSVRFSNGSVTLSFLGQNSKKNHLVEVT